MTENVGKLVGVVVMAVLVVVGVAVSSGDDTNFTRNLVILAAFDELPEVEQARLAPAFLEQAAPKSLDTGPINKINSEVGPIFKGATGYKLKNVIVTSLEASVLEGRGVDGKGGTGLNIWTTGGTTRLVPAEKAGFVAWPSADALGGRKASFRANGGMNGVADRIQKWNDCSAPDNLTVNSLKNVLVGSYMENTKDLHSWGCAADVTWAIKESEQLNQKSEQLSSFDQKTNQLKAQGEGMLHDTAMAIRVGKDEAGLLAACMESKVGDVFLKSHTEASAADCIATVMPAISPKRAKQLGTYWQTPEQLTALPPALRVETDAD